jgi:hypothetical protein
MPRAGQLPEPHGGRERERLALAVVLKLDNCFCNLRDPQFGQAGIFRPETRCSKISPQD